LVKVLDGHAVKDVGWIRHVSSSSTLRRILDRLVSLLERAGHSATAVATIAEAASILAINVPDLLATDVVLTHGSSTSLAKQPEAAGAKTLMTTAARTGSSRLTVPDNRTCQARFRPFQGLKYDSTAVLLPRGRRSNWLCRSQTQADQQRDKCCVLGTINLPYSHIIKLMTAPGRDATK
jgi:DNA-binding response OmpR family regulator